MNRNLLIIFKGIILSATLASMVKPGLLLAADNGRFIAQESSNIQQWADPVSESTLASFRGGFVLPNGLIVNISFEKQIFQNGIETFYSYFQTPENLALVKNGQLNIASELADTIIQSVIQNNLDNQNIQSINNIGIDIKNLNNISNTYSNNVFYTQFVLPNIYQ
ncbi:MAG: hypothetical protein ACJAZP_003612 [Psychromonas sp.]|jgi:hypothetical protein|uniref:hypothetical protein n=1 Tax=Psychromonas sp. TaxID=1884585 RepID=UPI0039E41486